MDHRELTDASLHRAVQDATLGRLNRSKPTMSVHELLSIPATVTEPEYPGLATNGCDDLVAHLCTNLCIVERCTTCCTLLLYG